VRRANIPWKPSVSVDGAWGTDFRRGHVGVKFEVEEAHHHFVPALLAPDDGLGGVGVFGIAGGIVEMGGAFDLGAAREADGIGEVVPELPVPVEGGDAEDGFGPAIGKSQAIFKRLAAAVHVRVQGDELDVFLHLKGGVHFVVGIARRNLKGSVGGGESQNAFSWGRFCEDEAEPGLVSRSFSVWRVVDFENYVRACFDELAFAGAENFRGLSGSVADQKIAGQSARVDLLVGFRGRSDKKDSRLLILEVVGTRLAKISNDVVDDRSVGWANFEHLHPFVLFEAGRNDDVLIVHDA